MKKNPGLIPIGTSLFIIAVGFLVLCGWIFNIPSLTSVLPGIGSMKFNTAVCFILAGFAFYLLEAPATNQVRKKIAFVCSWIILIVAGASFLEYLPGWIAGTDELVWKEGPGPIDIIYPGRMNLSTSVNFMLLGFIFLMLGKRKYHWPIQVLLIAMIPGSLLVIFTHIFGVSFLNNIPQLSKPALQTAILFLVLCFGIFFSSSLGYLRFSFMKKITGFFVLIFLVRTIIFFAINKNNEQTADTYKWLKHNDELSLITEQVNTQCNDIQSGVRGYIITGEENYSSIINNATDSIGNIIGRLRTITQDNPGQQRRIDTLEQRVESFGSYQNKLVNIRRNEGFEAAQKIMFNGQAKSLSNEVRSMISAIEQDENLKLVKRKAHSEESIYNSAKIFTLFQVIFFLVMLAALKLIYDNVKYRNKVEDALKKSLRDISDYKYALDQSSIVVITDQEGIIKQVNDNFCEISKYEREELVGQDHRIMNSGFHTPEFIRDLWLTIAGGKVWRGEIKNIAKDGTFYWLDTTIVPFLNEKGTPYQYLSIRSNITKRKTLEVEISQFNDALQKKVEEKTKEVIEKDQQYRFLLQNMREGIQVIGYDWKYLFVNNTVAQQVKYSNEELVGHTLMKKFSGSENLQLFKVLRRCMRKRNPEICETVFTFPDGTKGWFELSIQPVSEGLFILSMDITERKKAEIALAESENYLRTIYQAEPECVNLLDINGVFQDMNPAGLAMVEADDLQQLSGKSVLTIIDEPYRLAYKAFIQNIFKGASGKLEFEITGLKGTHRWLETHAVPLKNTDGKIVSLLAVTCDITEQKKANESIEQMNKILGTRAAELQASNTELERFAYIASHDLQEPLRMVTSFLNLLEKRNGENLDEKSRKFIYYAIDGSERMSQLIQDLLKYSRVGSNKEDFVETDPKEIIEYTTRVLQENIRDCRAVITLKPMPVIATNKTLFGQLFVNLINNALKYHNGTDPKIEVGCTEEPGEHIFYVKDNGIGIEPEFYDKIFNIFQRLHTKTEYSGTGIGLAICKKIVEIHHGKIWVQSESGKGSTFYFSIPKQVAVS